MHPTVLSEFDETQVKAVYAQFGLAMYQAQNLERQIAILLATEHGPQKGSVTQAQYEQLFECLFKKTMGGLINELLKAGTISTTFESDLRQALKQRNWLTHNYFWDRAGHLLTIKGREVMIEELTRLAYEFGFLDQQMTSISEQWIKKVGIKEDLFQDRYQKEFEKLLEEVK